jgi:uncharacterized membrane protein YbhN (UPF0104 family)
MEARDVASRMTTFMVLLYSIYMGALLVGGLGLYTGVIPGGGSFAMTILPAIFGGAVIALVAGAQLVKPGEHRVQKWLAPIGEGVRDARRLVRRGNPGLAGAIMWWAFDIACLWACFHAFGAAPAVGILVVGYFVGTLANTLPLPGGIGGVEGGMIGALVAFGVEPGLALIAVLAYRGFAFWLPIAPGAAAWFSLRRTVAGWERDDAEAATVGATSAMIGSCPGPSSRSARAISAAPSSTTSSRRAGTEPPSPAATTRCRPCGSAAR